MLNRRDALKSLGMISSGMAISPYLDAKPSSPENDPKRVIFFLQSQGFAEQNCSVNVKPGQSLKNAELPVFIKPLEPYKDKLTIIHGLHGIHTTPSHSAFFGCLGGYKRSTSTPFEKTIDCALSEVLPKAPIPLLSVGMESLERMRSRPVTSKTSAWGPGDGASMICSPDVLYSYLFGAIAKGQAKKLYDENTEMLNFVSKVGNRQAAKIQNHSHQVLKGFKNLTSKRSEIAAYSKRVKKYAPEYDDRFHKPKFETDWHDLMLEMTIAALRAGLTNVATINSGCGEFMGSWHGLGIKTAGHTLGHMPMTNETWTKIRQYNMQMLVKLIRALEDTPEGNGSMMNNTLIVYTSNNADKQHTDGAKWPFMTIGNWGGKLNEGIFLKVKNRPINSLYATLLNAAGHDVDEFNMAAVNKKHDSGKGLINELI